MSEPDVANHAMAARLFKELVDLDRQEQDVRLSEIAVDQPDLAARVRGFLDADIGPVASVDARIGLLSSVRDAIGSLGVGERAGDRVGPYKLLEVIGEGGFGTVWLAERREPMVQRVALKVIKPGMDSKAVVARFEQERQALAVMDHPNVAKVLDGGVAPSGRPYFVMEYVKGESITVFAKRHRLTIRQRLELFIPVCEAVQHAHMKGIIHRDIKPSNILVSPVGDRATGEGGSVHGTLVKVIDFGVAKAISHSLTDKTIFTGTGQVVGTPEYMSPEQAAMGEIDIDTRSDVYALGVLLYEILAERLPYDLRKRAVHEMARIIREDDPTRLSVAGRGFRGDIETIVGKALEKDRSRRYQSAESLAEDVRRYLSDEPITARPPSVWYQVSKFSRRHRSLVASVAAVASVLVVAVGVTSFALVRALQAESRTAAAAELERQQRELAEGTLAFWSTIMSQASRRYGSEAATIREALDVAAGEADEPSLGESSPALAARLHVIGQTFVSLEQFREAAPYLDRAVAMYEKSLGAEHKLTRTAAWDEAICRWGLGQSESLPALQDALERLLAVSDPTDQENWERMASLAALLGGGGQEEDARTWLGRLETARALAGDPPTSRYAGQVEMARAQIADTPEESIFHWRQAKDILSQIYGPNHIETIEAWRILCFTQSYTGKEADAVEEYKQLLPAARTVYASPNVTLADTIKEYAACLVVLQHVEEARALGLEAVAMYRQLGRQCDGHRSRDILAGLWGMYENLGDAQGSREIGAMIGELARECEPAK